jgi:hypothetical protein
VDVVRGSSKKGDADIVTFTLPAQPAQ